MLPPYVYDLIAAVQKWEDEHGDTSMCFEHVLDSVPKQELDRAAAIAYYQRERTRMETTSEDEQRAARELSAPPPPRTRCRCQLIPAEGSLAGPAIVQGPGLFRCGHPGCLGRHSTPNEACC